MKGGCLCGEVRYEISGAPLVTAVCHCKSCQRSSGAAFSINVIVAGPNLSLHGATKFFEERAESGNTVQRHFCEQCGSCLYSRLSTGVIAIKAGTLDDSLSIAPSVQFWTRSAQSWAAELVKVPAFATVPNQ